MKNLPFLVRYATNVVLSDGTTVLAMTAVALAAAIAAVNAAPETYGLAAGAVVGSAPTVPTGADGIAYVKGKTTVPPVDGQSFVFVDAAYSHGNSLPDTGAESILTAINLAAIKLANAALIPLITTGPITKTVAAPGATTFVVAASGAGLTYQWQKSTDTGATWTNIANAGVYTTATTATLNISNTTGLTLTQYRCIVTNTSGSDTSAAAVLTVTP